MEILRGDEISTITRNKIKNRPYWETSMGMINFIKLRVEKLFRSTYSTQHF